jgi:hypothetical protein
MIGLNLSGPAFMKCQFSQADVAFRELDTLDRLHSDPKTHQACGVRVQDCVVFQHAPRMLTPVKAK